MSGADVLFYALALVFAGAAAVSALAGDLGRALRASFVEGAAAVGLLALGAAWWPAGALAAATLTGVTIHRRADVSGAHPDDVSTLGTRLRTAALLVAFFAIAARAVLMARWPLATFAERAGAAVAPVGLSQHLVVALVVLSLGLFAAITRRTVAGVGLGLASALVAAVVALGAVARFVPGPGGAAELAALTVVSASASALVIAGVARRTGDLVRASDAAWRVAGGLAAALSGVTLALLVSAW